MSPRLGVVVAGAGALIAVSGAQGLGGDNLVNDDGDVQRLPGLALSLLVIAGGLVLLARARTAPLRTAGAIATALGIPTLLFFLTFDVEDFPPFSVDAVLLVSVIAWLALYAVGPAMGRLLFLVLALFGAWVFVMDQVEPVFSNPLGFTPFGSFESESSFESDSDFGEEELTFDEDGNLVFPEEDFETPSFEPDMGFDAPDPTNVGLVSLVFGGAYSFLSFVLTRRGFAGTGTGFAAAGVPALAAGVALLAGDLEEVGTGLLLLALGLAIAAVGAATGRRFTAWAGGAGIVFGVGVLIDVAVGDDASPTSISAVALVVGAAVVAFGHALFVGLDEPAEEDEVVSFPRREVAAED